jgi:hypothetical protein
VECERLLAHRCWTSAAIKPQPHSHRSTATQPSAATAINPQPQPQPHSLRLRRRRGSRGATAATATATAGRRVLPDEGVNRRVRKPRIDTGGVGRSAPGAKGTHAVAGKIGFAD